VNGQFSSRTGWDLNESAFAAAVRQARTVAIPGKPLIDLTVSNPTVCGFSYDASAILSPLASPAALTYDPDPRGIRSAREAVARYYADHGAAIDPDALILTTSTSEAYSYLFRLLCDVGDEVLVAQPSYPLFDFLADLEDVRLRTYPLFYDYGWWIDFAELERRIGPRTRALLVVHPNNPTGHWTARQEREQLRALCAKHNLSLIVDEVFLDYPLSPSEDAVSFAAEEAIVPTFVLSGMSKIAGLPQMKAAWLLTLGPESLRREAFGRLEVIADTYLSMNAPIQLALLAWLVNRHPIQNQILARSQANLVTAQASGLQVLQTQAGWSAVLRASIPVEALISQHSVIAHPGSFYGMTEGNRLVVSLLTSEADFALGIARILSA
jgi:aspartate/methionine/tyrosine aminotransferase